MSAPAQRAPQHLGAQSPRIRVAHVIDPPLQTGVKFGKADLVETVGPPPLPQTAAEMAHIPGLDAAVAGIDDETEPRDAMGHWKHRGLGVYGEPQHGEPFDNGLLPAPQLPFAITKEGKIIDVAHIGVTAQLAFHKVIEGIEVAVGPKLRGQIADGQAARA